MPRRSPADPDLDNRVAELAARQAGVVARRQLRVLGVPRRYVRHRLRRKQWQRLQPGSFATFTGPPPAEARIWAAILYAGRHAVASHGTAAWLHGLRDTCPDDVDVAVRHGRRHRPSRRGVRVRQTRHLEDRRHPAATPPRTRLEDTVLDLCDEYRTEGPVVDLVITVCQRRLTTAARLRDAARKRKRMRWRALTRDLLCEVEDGVQSVLERRYRRDVEIAHGLPRGERNAADVVRGRRRYRDVRYRRYRAVVELDGRATHPDELSELDAWRDNELVTEEDVTTLRYGWRSVAGRPCVTATQVGALLTRNGWTGRLRRCDRQDCTAGIRGSAAA